MEDAAGPSAGAAGVNTMEDEKQRSSLTQRVETMASVIELLLETLKDLSDEEFEEFKKVLNPFQFRRAALFMLESTDIQSLLLKITDKQEIVFSVVQTHGQKSVEKTKEVLKKMKRTDLVQRFSDSSSGDKKKHSVDEHLSALIHKVATMVAFKELLLETLTHNLSYKELNTYKWLLQFTLFKRNLPQLSWEQLWENSVYLLVDVMVEKYGQQSVEVTKEVFMDMNRMDLGQRLSETSSGPKEKHSVDEHWPALTQKVETMASVIELLLETLKDLSYGEVDEFKKVLRQINFPLFGIATTDTPWMQLETMGLQDTVFLLVQTFGQQSVETTKEVLKMMKRTDLDQRLSDSSTESKKKSSTDEQRSALIQKVATIAAVKQLLLETLNDLSNEELKKFNEFLRFISSQRDPQMDLRHTADRAEIVDLMVETYGQQSVEVTREVFFEQNQQFLRQKADREDRAEIVDLMVETYSQQSVEVTREVFMELNRTDLVQRLSKPSSGLKEGPSGSLELKGCGSSTQDSSDWTKLEPEVNSTDADEAPFYSLQTEAGKFECSVSGLRWLCKEKVSFKYQFCSWEEHIERMESIQYMPAGPLIDITVSAGRLDEVYLPHWICTDDPAILDKFAVLHINDCGDEVEKVSEVTQSHVKLSEPVFSPRAVLMKAGIPVKVNCNVLIYKTNTAFLTLHVYLIPRDPGLQQAMDKRELSYGYKVIRKPPPEKSLKVRDRFLLTADLDGAEIYPETFKFTDKDADSHFFEVFIDNPDTNFKLQLKQEKDLQPVWIGAIRKGEYKITRHVQGEHFVDKHQCDLIERVSNIGPILDNLLKERVIQQQDYDAIRAIPITQEKMRTLYSGPLKAGGHAAKDIFYNTLKEKESYLVDDLKRKLS